MSSERLLILRRGTGFAALTGVCLSALAFGAAPPFAWSMLALFTLILFAILVLQSNVAGTQAISPKLLIPLLAFMAVIVLSLAVPNLSVLTTALGLEQPITDADARLRGALRLGLYGMHFLIAVYAFNTFRSATAAFKFIAIWSTLLAAFGFYAFLTGENPILGSDDPGAVLKASFVNRNHYATYAAFGLIINLGLYFGTMQQRAVAQPIKRRLRDGIELFFGGAWIYAVGAIVCGAAVAATASRAGSISALFGLLIFAVAWAAHDRKLRYALFGVIVVGLGFVLYSSTTNLFRRFKMLDDTEGRFLVWPEVIQGILDKPVLGYGLGSFKDAFQQYVPLDAARAEWTEAHSSYLEVYFEMGIPLATLLFLCFIPIVWRIYRGTRMQQRERSLSCIALGCIAAGALHAAFDFSFQIPAVTTLFAIILGLGWSQSFSETEVKRLRVG